MLSYLARRVSQALIVLLGAVTIIFVVIRIVPGDPASLMLGTSATKEDVQRLHAALGLDEPLIQQYGLYLSQVLQLDFGESYRLGGNPMEHLIGRLPATLELAAAALVLMLLLSFPLGIWAARKPYGWVDRVVSVLALGAQALPQFWIGIMLILVLARTLDVLPSGGTGSVAHLIMPTVALALPFIGWVTRLVRDGIIGQTQDDYVRTARAKGLAEWVIFYIHILRNALVPVVTVVGLIIGDFITAAVIVEVVFAWPGIGRLLIDSIAYRDYAVVQAVTLFVAFVYVLLNMVVDLLYVYLDPRIRLRKA